MNQDDNVKLEKHNYTLLLQEKHETADALLKAQLLLTKTSKENVATIQSLISIAERHLMDVRRKLASLKEI